MVHWTGASWNSGIDGGHVSLRNEKTGWEEESEEEVFADGGTVSDKLLVKKRFMIDWDRINDLNDSRSGLISFVENRVFVATRLVAPPP